MAGADHPRTARPPDSLSVPSPRSIRSARSDPEATGNPPASEARHRSGRTMKQTAGDRKA